MLQCVKNISVSDNECLKKCDGLFITGIDRREFDKEQVEEILSEVNDDYEQHKTGRNIQIPPIVGGKQKPFKQIFQFHH